MSSLSSTAVLLKGLLRYTIKQKIGAGGMATVYCADDHVLRREVALKILHEHLINSPESVRRFSSEARAVATLSHENVVKIFDCGEIESRPYLVMEYVKGQSLQQIVDKNGTLPNLVALEVCRQVLQGLACAHSKGIFHRDIKPDNIIIDQTGTVKIMDFGIAYIVNQESLTMTGSFLGSPRYISPEQAEGKPLAGTTDIFSVGVLLYVALTGKLPFNADVAAAVVHSIIHDTPPPVFKHNPSVLFWISDLVGRFLQKDPLARPDSMGALAGIDKECLHQGVKIGIDRLRRFLGDPEKYATEETGELFDHYRLRARKAASVRQVAQALKSLEQAKVFGLLTKDDERIISSDAFRRRFKTAGLAVGLFCGACACLYIMFHFLSIHKERLKTEQGVSAPATDSTAIDKKQGLADSSSRIDDLKTAIDSQKKVRPHVSKVPLKMVGSNEKPVQDMDVMPPINPGFIKIQTNPPWAKVFIDNIERGITPEKTMYPLPSGPHELKIVKEGFAEYRRTVPVPAGDTVRLRIQLTP